jgi:hypothetical protein
VADRILLALGYEASKRAADARRTA